MKTFTLAALAVTALGLTACSTTEERIGGAAVGAGSPAHDGTDRPRDNRAGSGAVTGPTVARTTRRAVR